MESHLSSDARLAWLIALFAAGFSMSACATGRSQHGHRSGLFDQPEKRYQARVSPRARSVLPIPPRSEKPDPEELDTIVPASAVRKIRAQIQSWKWPVANPYITSRFGVRRGDMHEGIDLRAPKGSPVYATESGTVIYSDKRLSGYGNMIVVKHRMNLSTIYAHNSRNLVRVGQKVKQGQKIALAGSTGHSSGPHLHFELRQGVNPVDPLAVLPHPFRGTLVRAEPNSVAKAPRRSIASVQQAKPNGPRRYKPSKKSLKAKVRAKKGQSSRALAAREHELDDDEFEKTRRHLNRGRPQARARQ